jgi:hypothetical protein
MTASPPAHTLSRRTTRRPDLPVWRAGRRALLATLVLAAGGCAAPAPGPATLDPAAAAVLADRAERLADHLDADDGCAAREELASLLAVTHERRDDGEVPDDVVAELETVLTELDAAATCDPDERDPDPDRAPDPDPDPDPDADPDPGRGDGGGGSDEAEGRGRGGPPPGRGNGPPPGRGGGRG